MKTTIRELPGCEYKEENYNSTCGSAPRYVVTFSDGSEMYLCFCHAAPFIGYKRVDLKELEKMHNE